MSDTPFGFNRPGGGDGDDDKPQDPFQAMGGGDMRQFADMLHRFADMIGAQGAPGAGGGPLNWDLAKNIARHQVAEQGDPSVVDAERRQVTEALRLADLWLDEGTTLPAGIRAPEAWSRSEWIERTLPVWSKVCDPIAKRMVESMGGALGQGDIPPEMQAMAGPLIGMVQQMAGAMVGGQAGQALGALAREVVGSADVGLPLAPDGVGALLPAGVAAFGEGLELSEEEVRLYLALREAAHQRLFAHVPWLRTHLMGAVEDYARGITVDLSGIEQAVQGLDLSNPEAIQQALGNELQLTPEETPQQKAALARLETTLALVEGWVDTVVNQVARDRLPGSVQLAEAIRRRRATGGPAERTFTSGSSGAPRGVMVTWENLEANVELIARTAGFTDGDGVSSWLPLYHDMGLIGCFIAPITWQMDLRLMRPDHFIREPARWVRTFEHAVHTAAPPFAYAYAARRIKPEQLEGVDLSGWRTAIIGAEPIDPHALEVFARLTEPFGFRRESLKPAYGMAEATLLITMDQVRRRPLAVRPDDALLEFGQAVRIVSEHELGESSVGARAGWVVGCGTPEDDVPVLIVDDEGRELDEGCLGEIVVGGRSACAGYYAGAEGKSTRFDGGFVYTGDAGFFYRGQLFVLGRMGDSIKVRGRSVYVEDLESKVAEVSGLGKGRVVVVGVPGAGTKGLALFAETQDEGWVGDVREMLRRRIGGDVEVTVVVGAGLIQRTSSGKPRRRYMWELLRAGRMDGARVV